MRDVIFLKATIKTPLTTFWQLGLRSCKT